MIESTFVFFGNQLQIVSQVAPVSGYRTILFPEADIAITIIWLSTNKVKPEYKLTLGVRSIQSAEDKSEVYTPLFLAMITVEGRKPYSIKEFPIGRSPNLTQLAPKFFDLYTCPLPKKISTHK